MDVRLDYTNMLASAIGPERGVTDSELEALKPQASRIHADLQSRRDGGGLPFFDLPFADQTVHRCEELADQLADRFANLVVLGIGGSALGTLALFRALCPLHYNLLSAEERQGRPRLFVLDNVDPVGIRSVLDLCRPQETVFCVISKSGTTVETSAQFAIAQQWLRDSVGDSWREHLLAITDPEQGALRQMVSREGLTALDIPGGVGGRFSLFTPVGLLPLAAVGVPLGGLLGGARQMADRVSRPGLLENPAYLNAALQYLAYGKGMSISVMMPYSDQLRDIADWYRQLWAESLGKKYSLTGETIHVGPTPVKALGTTDQHSQVQLYMEGPFDKVVTFLTLDRYADELEIPSFPEAESMAYLAGKSMAGLIREEQRATALALCKNGRPNCSLRLGSVTPENVGALIYLLEVQTLFAGGLFGIDPLDQPGVEEGKQLTYGLMGRPGFEERKTEVEAWEASVTHRQL